MSTREQAEKRVNLMKNLLKWRLRLQWTGGIIMVPSVLAALVMNIGWVPLSLAEPLLWAIGVAIVILLGSMACTIAFNNIKDSAFRKSVAEYEKENKPVE